MFLGHESIEKRIKKENLVENFLQEGVQGSGVDFRIGELFEVSSSAFLGENKRELPELKSVKSENNAFVLKPNKYYLLKTIERVNMPNDLIAFILNRSSLFRCGASIRSAVIDPGYKGELTLGIKNESNFEIKIEKGARVAQVVFAKVDGKTKGYNGRYQGGKIL